MTEDQEDQKIRKMIDGMSQAHAKRFKKSLNFWDLMADQREFHQRIKDECAAVWESL